MWAKYKKLAVWFGNEVTGISKLALEKSALCINIPMFGMIESLNLGTSSGIVFYEITKQRREFQFRLKEKRVVKRQSQSAPQQFIEADPATRRRLIQAAESERGSSRARNA